MNSDQSIRIVIAEDSRIQAKMLIKRLESAGYEVRWGANGSEALDLIRDDPPDLIISVCSSAEKECPVFPGQVERLHWPFDDPAHATGTDEEKQSEFRRVRDEIGSRLER